MPVARRSPLQAYAVALAAVAGAAVLRQAIDGWVGDRVPYAVFVMAVAIVGLYGSRSAAIVATVLSAIIGNVLFVPPRGALTLALPELIWVGVFVAVGVVVAGIADQVQRARRGLELAATAREHQAAAIHNERQRLKDIVASIPGVVWEAWGEPDSSQQRINFVSDYVETMLGYKPEEWTATPNFWLQVVHPDDRERAARKAAEIFASGGIGENEFRWVSKDGRTLWVVARSSTITDDLGVPIGMRGVTLDITLRKEVEQRLSVLAEISTTGLAGIRIEDLAQRIAQRAAEAVGDYCVIRMLHDNQLEAIASAHVDSAAEPIIRKIASQSDLLTLSSLYADIVQKPRTLIENNLPEEAFAHVDRRGVEDEFEKHRARRGLFTPLFAQGRLVGTLAIGRAGGEPFTVADAQFTEAIAARASLALENARLVEAAQRDAEEARGARAEAEEAGRVKDEFLATLSHELRTPLNAILGWAHMLRDPQLPEERRRAAIETILRNAQSQEQLIADILDVQRIMTGKIRLNVRTVDLGNVIRTAAETVQPSADAKGVRLQLLLDLDAPAITGDPDRLQQIVWNLLTNAIKFAPPGGRVEARLLRTDDSCELVVEDNGPGINPDFLPYVFERFRQADSSTTRTHKGLGLGLAIVRSLVEMHGGTISARNSDHPDKTGAVFTIRLPRLSPQTAAADLVVDREASWSRDMPDLAGVRVLVVEDDGDARELLAAILERCNAQVTVAASVPEGIAAFTSQRPDVVVSDIEMPEQDGFHLIRRIRSLPPQQGGDVPVAALTAYASAADRMKTLGAGFNIHVAKPVQPAELAVVVSSLAGRRVQ